MWLCQTLKWCIQCGYLERSKNSCEDHLRGMVDALYFHHYYICAFMNYHATLSWGLEGKKTYVLPISRGIYTDSYVSYHSEASQRPCLEQIRGDGYRLTFASPHSVLLFVHLDIIWAAEGGATCFVTSLYKGAVPWPAPVTYTVRWSVDWAFVHDFKFCSILSHVWMHTIEYSSLVISWLPSNGYLNWSKLSWTRFGDNLIEYQRAIYIRVVCSQVVYSLRRWCGHDVREIHNNDNNMVVT